MKTIRIRSEYDCIVRHKDGESFLDLNSELIFDEPEKILVYPLTKNKNLFPFFIDLNSNEKSKFFQYYCFKNYDIVYLSNSLFIKNEIIEKIEISGKEYKVFINEEKITFEGENHRKTFFLQCAFENYNITTNGNLIILHLVGDVENMLFFNVETNKIEHITGRKIEKIGDKLLVSIKQNDIAFHEVYETYSLTNENVKKESTKLKFETDSNLIKNEKVIPLAFLEAIKIDNFDIAKSYLSGSLKTTSNEHFKAYFKDINKIIPVDDYIIGVFSQDVLNLYKFTISSGQITEIEQYE